MKNILRIEEGLMLAFAIYLNSFLPYPAWLFWALFLAPDVAIIGYLVNTRVGAITYNFFHHKGVAITVYLVGAYLSYSILQFIGLLLFGHSSFDRILGYGLKYPHGFKETHLGRIGH